MTFATFIQLAAACIGIVGSLFFAIGIVRQNANAMACLSYTYWDANPHMPAVLAAQKADYIFGGGLIVLAFGLQFASFFSTDAVPFLSARAAAVAPWIALVLTSVIFFAFRIASVRLARHYQAHVEDLMRKEQEEDERKGKEQREPRKNAS